MISPTQGPLVSAVAFEAMDTEQISKALKAHGFSVVGSGPRNVVGSRPVPGHLATDTREAAFWRIPESSAWTGTLQLRYPHPRAGEPTGSHLNAPGARFPAFTMRLLSHCRWMREVGELTAWLTTAAAEPIDDMERVAIAAGKA